VRAERKVLLRLGLRGRHPHPPAPSPASGRGGEAGELRDTRARDLRGRSKLVRAERKVLLRLGLRGRHPHPPDPSPASGRGGETLNRARCVRGLGLEQNYAGCGSGSLDFQCGWVIRCTLP
jgi:hypothetical protein